MADSGKEVASFESLGRGGQNLLFGCRLLNQFAALGVEHIVISPGSRSTPLTLAAARLNEAGRLTTHVRLDERSAAFFALGIGKATGKPAVLICTSGTAVANYYPAVIEARMTSTPLIVISADRPASLQQMMAPQTINQTHIFGDYPVMFRQSEELVENDIRGDKTYSLAAEIYGISIRKAGPSHLNAAFSKPLEPSEKVADAIVKQVLDEEPELRTQTPSPERILQDDDGLNALFTKLRSAVRPLIVTGPLNVSSNAERELLNITLSMKSVPHLLEATSGMQRSAGENNLIFGYESFLRKGEIRAQLKPDFILRIGPPAVSRALNDFFKVMHDVPQWCFSSSEHIPDPVKTSERFIQWAPFAGVDAPQSVDASSMSVSEKWLDAWQHESSRFAKKIPALHEKSATSTALTDGHIIRSLIGILKQKDLKSDYQLFVSNSFGVRDVDLFNAGKLDLPQVYHNRGASGIDGITSAALGTAIGSEKPVWLVIGELSFLHDTNAMLQLSRYSGPKLRILILNNSGGTIFRMLPVSSHKQQYKTYFETPQQVDIQKLCSAYGVKSIRIENPASAEDELNNAKNMDDAVMILEAVTDTECSMQERRALWENA